MQQKDAQKLLKKYLDGTCTAEEKGLLETWYLLHEGQNLPVISQSEKDKQLDEVWQTLPIHDGKVNHINYWPRILAAASVILLLSVGGYFISHRQQQITLLQQADVVPGGNKAILILSSGKQIDLAKAKAGEFASDANTRINKASDGTLSYKGADAVNTGQLVYNTIKTPAGGQWKAILPDGSMVVLDAASSITYPVAFKGKERIVSITGQVYFEVVHRADQKFMVTTKNQTVEDIGTHFNIKAYDNEPQIKTTLLEGSVKVFNAQHSLTLKPGEQAVIPQNKTEINLKAEVSLQQAVAWKDGVFRFRETGLHELMRELARWYNIEVIYKGDVKDEPYYGTISRNMTLAEALKILQLSDIHLIIGPKTQGNAGTLTITP